MEINATLFIQFINFLVAYLMLRSLFLKPAIKEIMYENGIKNDLATTVTARRVIIEQKTAQKLAQWKSYQQDFIAHMPSLLRTEIFVFKDLNFEVSHPRLSSEYIEKTSDHIASQLTKRLEHE